MLEAGLEIMSFDDTRVVTITSFQDLKTFFEKILDVVVSCDNQMYESYTLFLNKVVKLSASAYKASPTILLELNNQKYQLNLRKGMFENIRIITNVHLPIETIETFTELNQHGDSYSYLWDVEKLVIEWKPADHYMTINGVWYRQNLGE